MFTVQGPGDIPLDQPVDYLDFFDDLAVLDDLETWPFYDQIVLLTIQQILGADLRNEFCVRDSFSDRLCTGRFHP